MVEKKQGFLKTVLVGYIQALKNHVWLRWVHLSILIQILIGAFLIKPDLTKCVEEPHIVKSLFGMSVPFGGFNLTTVVMTWMVMLFLITVSLIVSRNLKEKPGRLQVTMEKLVEFFKMLCEDTLKERGIAFIPLIGAIFLVVWFSNLVGLIPLPHFEEPTSNVNFTLGLGIIAFITSHVVAIKVRGFIPWAKAYFFALPLYVGLPSVLVIVGFIGLKVSDSNLNYIWPLIVGMVISGYVLKLFLGSSVKFYIPNPLDMIGEVGKVVSHSMRLFGNIFGGVIIMVVISKLTHYIFFPTLLSAFFGIFVGTVQAFVFAMLALVYISVLIAEE